MPEIKTLWLNAQPQPVKFQIKHVHYADMQIAIQITAVMDGILGVIYATQPTHTAIGNLPPMRVVAKRD
jgi:hypothetical protein